MTVLDDVEIIIIIIIIIIHCLRYRIMSVIVFVAVRKSVLRAGKIVLLQWVQSYGTVANEFDK